MSGKHKPKPYKKRFCMDCGKELEKSRGNAAKRCPECQKFTNTEASNLRRWERRRKSWGYQAKSDLRNKVGTGELGEHMKKKKDGTGDWDKELKAIKAEKRRLGLK